MQMNPPRRKYIRRNKHLRLIRPGLGSSETDALAMQAAAAYLTGGASTAAGAGAGSAPGTGASSVPAFQPSTAVSPNIQTQISPQISPTFIQSSGGGTQSGSAIQTQGSQSGQGGGAGIPLSPAGYSSADPLLTGAPSPLVGAGLPQYTGQYTPSLVQTSAFPSWVLPVAILAIIGGVGYYALKKR